MNAARRTFAATYENLRSTRGTEGRITQRALRHLVKLYGAWGKPEQAETYQELVIRE